MRDLGNKNILARNMKRLMEEKNISAKQLSSDIEVPYTTVLSWLKADNYPRINKIDAMAKRFGVLKSDLIEEAVTPEIKKDNGVVVKAVAQMRSDKEFLSLVDSLRTDKELHSLVVSLHNLDTEKRKVVGEMLGLILK